MKEKKHAFYNGKKSYPYAVIYLFFFMYFPGIYLGGFHGIC